VQSEAWGRAVLLASTGPTNDAMHLAGLACRHPPLAWIPTIQIGATSGPDAAAVRTLTGQKSPQGFPPATDLRQRLRSGGR